MTSAVTRWQRQIIEKVPSLRYRAWQAVSRTLFAHAFASFGQGTVIESPRILRGLDHISLGSRCIIHAGAWLQCEPEGGPLTIADDCYLGHRVHLHAGASISIGQGCVIADDVFIASVDHARHGDRHLVTSTGPITIGDHVFIGQRAIILGGITIGQGATVGAGAVVTRNVEPGAVVAGIPARPLSPRSQSTRIPPQ